MGTRRRKSEWPDYYDKVWCKERGEGGNCLLSLLPLFLSNVYHTIPIQLRRKRGKESAEFGVISSSVRHSSSRFPFISARSLLSPVTNSPPSRGSVGGNEKRCFRGKKARGKATTSCSLAMFSSLMRLSGLVSVTRAARLEAPKTPKASLLLL